MGSGFGEAVKNTGNRFFSKWCHLGALFSICYVPYLFITYLYRLFEIRHDLDRTPPLAHNVGSRENSQNDGFREAQ